METQGYLRWLASETKTVWWHDSADPPEVDRGLDHAAIGVTTNPVLAQRARVAHVARWRDALGPDVAGLSPVEQAEAITRVVAVDSAHKLEAVHAASGAAQGYVCAQVDPTRAGDRETMLAMACRYHTWAPNIAVKMPVTAAGLDVLEECVAKGITVTATVSFTVPQVVAVAERHRAGAARARQAGIEPGHCFAVIMIGRLDDYIQDVAWDSKAELSQADIQQAGLPIDRIWMIGGATESPQWPGIVADVTGLPLFLPRGKNWPAVGAAILAGAGTGVFATVDAGQACFQRSARAIEPVKTRTPVYDEGFADYQRLCGRIANGQG